VQRVTDTNKRISRRDVAKAAGVSLTTVTHALSETPGTRVNQDTRRLVKRIATELGYRPSFVGKALSVGKTYTVGLLLPKFGSLRYGFYQDICMGLSEAMKFDDYNMLLLFREEDFSYMKVIDQGKVDAFIIIQSDFDTSHIDRVVSSGIPTVVINKWVDTEKFSNLACVCSDNKKFVKDFLDDFQSMRCKNVLAIHDYLGSDTNSWMYRFFNEELEKRAASGLTGASIIPAKENRKQQFLNLLRSGQRWDGIFIDCSSDGSILIDAASECGIDAGKDFTLISTSTEAYSFTLQRREYRFYSQQGQLMGRDAWKLLSFLMYGDIQNKTIFVPYEKCSVNKQKRKDQL